MTKFFLAFLIWALAGTYDLLLHLPDASPSLAARPEYSIQTANTGWLARFRFP